MPSHHPKSLLLNEELLNISLKLLSLQKDDITREQALEKRIEELEAQVITQASEISSQKEIIRDLKSELQSRGHSHAEPTCSSDVVNTSLKRSRRDFETTPPPEGRERHIATCRRRRQTSSATY